MKITNRAIHLEKKSYVKNWSHMRPDELHTISVQKGNLPRKDINPERISYIIEEIGYWRKANEIHNWFVENVQNQNDDCGSYYVPPSKIEELLNICKNLLSSLEVGNDGVIMNPEIAEEILPTTSGFFFGSTEYDQYYIKDLERTVSILETALRESEYGDIYYQSSW